MRGDRRLSKKGPLLSFVTEIAPVVDRLLDGTDRVRHSGQNLGTPADVAVSKSKSKK